MEKNNKKRDFESIERAPEQAHVGTHDAVIEILKNLGPGELLDIGAGTGYFASRVAKLWQKTVNVTEIKKECVKEPGLIVSEVNCDSDKLPYPDSSFDYVTFVEIIEHLKNPWFAVSEIQRVLKPNGVLVFTTPNISNFRSKLLFLLKNKFPQFENEEHFSPLEHLHPFAMGELKLILSENNFNIEKINYGEGYRTRRTWLYYKKFRAGRPFLRNFFGYCIQNILYIYSRIVSFLLYGSFSTRNRTYGVTIMLTARKKNGK